MKKLFTLVLVISFIINIFSVITALAEEPILSKTTSEPSLLSENALFQIRAEFAPQSIVDYLKENGITVKDDSIIEILPIKEEMGGLTEDSYNTILCVTNIDGDTVYKDVLITFTKDDNGSLTIFDVPTNLNDIHPTAGTTIEFPPDSWDDRLTIRGTAVYNLYSDGFWTYYQPYGCYFTYTKKSGITVSYISVEYICDGFVYTYPAFKPLNYEVEHVVGVYKYNPAPNTMYSNTNYFDSDKVIDVSSGSPFVGNFLTFHYTIDGKTYGYTVKF